MLHRRLLALAFVIAACDPATPPASRQLAPSATPSPTAPAAAPTPTPAPTWPLTGMPRDGDASVRPIAVRFDNALPSQPQAGLAQADIVFETLIESCVSRLLAVYHSKVAGNATLGSIRSARLYDLQLLPMLRGVLAHVGAADEVSQMIRDAASRGDFIDVDAYKFENYPAYTEHYWRVAHKGPPYNLYTSLESLRAAVAKAPDGTMAVAVPSWGFSSEPTTQGVPAETFTFPGAGTSPCPLGRDSVPGFRDEYAPTYTYAARGYRREANEKTTVDETTKQPILASNVIVVYSDLAVTDIVESAGSWGVSYSILPRTTGTGKVAIYRDGRRIDGTWSRADNFATFDFRDSEGVKILLAPGQSWVHIVPTYWSVR